MIVPFDETGAVEPQSVCAKVLHLDDTLHRLRLEFGRTMKMTRLFRNGLKTRSAFHVAIAFFALLLIPTANLVQAGMVAWVENTVTNSNATFAVNASYTTNYGIAFKTGANGPYSIDWITIGLNSASSSNLSASFKVSLRNTTDTTPYSAAAGSTEHAVDTVSFTTPATTSTNFDLALTATQLPNISAFAMSANTAYSLIIYNSSANNVGIQRQTGLAQGTTNNQYTVGGGFSMLNTFKNNNQYTNTANSYPTLDISFGQITGEVPEPTSMAIFGLGTAAVFFKTRRRKQQAV